ncbi:GT2 family glycosyltransferase [Nocardiopsis mwathae]|uniref:GT2 family glycosyltransferase n=1 Tax=Nocardiopsis mwathae TaxID=1472723 RepID=A0A7W9YIX8_9ACTN|nr:GT2 family glycosyltransferase [Nocardiopsis mwathae]
MSSFEYIESRADGVTHRGRAEQVPTRIFRNDWGALAPPRLGAWEPRLSVSVVIPARGPSPRLAVTLAALAGQTYPARLLEVVVVDDRTWPPLALPPLRPARCRIERAPATGSGAGHARAYGAHVTSGAVICWLDPDMVVGPRFVEALVRWQHAHAECVSLGRVLHCPRGPEDPTALAGLARSGGLSSALAGSRDHAGVNRLLEHSDDLRGADRLGFQAYVGAAASLRRSLYEAAGGVDPALDLGQDTEFAYRLWQAGGLFLPEHAAPAWHIGQATPARTRIPSSRFRTDVLAPLMPHPRPHRDRVRRHAPPTAGRPVPLVRAVVDVAGARYETVSACVDRLLNGSEEDVGVTLVADWDGGVHGGAPEHPRLDLRLVQARYLADPRVSFSAVAPRTGFPAPYLLQVPVAWGLGRDTLARLVARAERSRAGLVELFPESAPTRGAGIRLWRTRALTRALRVRTPGEPMADVVAEVHGRYRMHADEASLEDLIAPRSAHDGVGTPPPAGGRSDAGDHRAEESEGASAGECPGAAPDRSAAPTARRGRVLRRLLGALGPGRIPRRPRA